MATTTITGGTYTNYNLRTNNDVIITGNITVVGDFLVRSNTFINARSAIITTSGNGTIALIANGFDPSSPGTTVGTLINVASKGIDVGQINADNAAVALAAIPPSGASLVCPTVYSTTDGLIENKTLVKCRDLFIFSMGEPTTSTANNFVLSNSNSIFVFSHTGSISRSLTSFGTRYTNSSNGNFYSINYLQSPLPQRYNQSSSDSRNYMEAIIWLRNRIDDNATINLDTLATIFGNTGKPYSVSSYYRGGTFVTPSTISLPANLSSVSSNTLLLGSIDQFQSAASGKLTYGMFWDTLTTPGTSFGKVFWNGDIVANLSLSGNVPPPSSTTVNGETYSFEVLTQSSQGYTCKVRKSAIINITIPASGQISFSNFRGTGKPW
jgi:hypothetical protein